jgi:acyl-CoA thioester hydrolase
LLVKQPIDRPVSGGSGLDPRFRFVRSVPVRFRDLDALGHVNHVVYLSYVEQVRTEYFRDVLLIDVPDGLTWVIARVWCDYLLPLAFGETVEVGWRISRLGGASADYEFELARGGQIVARGGGVLVNSDARAARSAPIPEPWRERAAQFEGIEPRTGRST